MKRLAILGALALILTGCSAPAPEPTPTPTAEASGFDAAWDWCLYAHPEPYEVQPTKADGTTDMEADPVMQTPEEGCQRWLDKVGEAEFTEQWNEDYATTARCGLFVLANPDAYPDEVDTCIEAAS
jgi:hypothetical protein